LEEPPEVCPPHAAARSKMMQKGITTAGFFLLRLFPNVLLRLSKMRPSISFPAQASADLKILWI
jgi:hypothetical protein